MRRRAAGLADFDFEAAARDVDLPVAAADFRLALADAAGRCAELAGAFFADELFAGAFLAAGFFFDDAADLAVFFADGVDEAVPAAAVLAGGDCAGRLVPDSSRQIATAATQDKVLLFGILLRSNHGLGGESRRATLACTRIMQRPHFNCKPRSGYLARHAAEGTSRGTYGFQIQHACSQRIRMAAGCNASPLQHAIARKVARIYT